MEQPQPDIQDTIARMERSQKERANAATSEQKPAGPLWVRNLRDLVVIITLVVGFAIVSVVAIPYLPKSAWVVIYVVGAAVVGIYIRSLARKKEPNQSPQPTRASGPGG